MSYELSVNVRPGKQSGFDVVIAAIAPNQSTSSINNLNRLDSLLENFDELVHLLE